MRLPLTLLLCLAAGPALARVDDAEWKRLDPRARGLWDSKAFAKRQQAIELLGTADREEAVGRLLALLGDDAIAAPEAKKRNAELRAEYDRGMATRDELWRVRDRGRNWSEQEAEAYDRLIRRLKRLTRQLGRLEKTLTEASLLRHAVLRALARSTDPAARKGLYATGLKHERAAVRATAAQALWLAGDRAAAPHLRGLIADEDPIVAGLAMRAAGALGDADASSALLDKLKSKRWRLRAAAIAALGQLRHRPALAPLIEAMQGERGRLAEDIHQALVRILGHPYGSSPETWKAWYAANAGRLDEVLARRKAANKTGHSFGTVAFYGIHTSSRRICFVIDFSGSMKEQAGRIDPRIAGGDRRYPRKGTKLQVARYELQKAIDKLPEQARFNIVYFNSSIRIYREGGLIDCDARSKKKVTNWLRYRIRAFGGTRMFDALARGLTEPVDTIYFLTDGTPTSGRLKQPDAILEEISMRNQRLGVTLHVIAIGKEVDVAFLQKLARRNRGTFVHTNN